MSTAVAITGMITRTILDLAFIGAGLKIALAVAPRFQVAAPKAPQVRVKLEPETVAPDAPHMPPKLPADWDGKTGTFPLGGSS